ncbi:hypothetical protein RFI_33897 [Reticulomyxa filosa]|uniref:Uncharacterized protein n=1 Tax=Reticulomyxa filosa TaxID=46433 RepID=X6LNK7_RETFI|nr:hypothetical protein RFI_33897 [Reticulomyxa filosa]|eukprot:ETO03508.1 hypothetical protein RFI_33897 [Reticulomyxa filosa]
MAVVAQSNVKNLFTTNVNRIQVSGAVLLQQLSTKIVLKYNLLVPTNNGNLVRESLLYCLWTKLSLTNCFQYRLLTTRDALDCPQESNKEECVKSKKRKYKCIVDPKLVEWMCKISNNDHYPRSKYVSYQKGDEFCMPLESLKKILTLLQEERKKKDVIISRKIETKRYQYCDITTSAATELAEEMEDKEEYNAVSWSSEQYRD